MCSATVGWVCAPARAGTRSERSNGTARGIGGSGEVAANVGSAAHRAQAGRPRAHAGGAVGPRRGVHRRPCPRLSDVGLAHGRPATRARAPGARRLDRCHARLGPAPLVRLVAHAADRRIYALRDVTGTVEAIPLIAASIMSKKLAEGLNALVLDVKRGSGAFLPKLEQSLELARTMIALGEDRSCPTVALLTAMDRPLGRACGNALETEEAILALRGEGPEDLLEVTYALGAEMLLAAGIEKTSKKARQRLANALASGLAAEKFEQVIEAQGGNPKAVEDPSVLPQAKEVEVYAAPRTGVVVKVEPKTIGRAIVAMGGGRRTVEDEVDPTVGFVITVKPGSKVLAGEPIASVFARDPGGMKLGFEALQQAIVVGARLTEKPLRW